MSCSAFLRSAALCALLTLGSTYANAGGFADQRHPTGKVICYDATALLASSNAYRDGGFRVEHTDTAFANVSSKTVRTVAYGSGQSHTSIQSDNGFYSWKKTVERGRASAVNSNGSASGFSATFLKVQTPDGRYFMYKGYVSATASLKNGVSNTNTLGLVRSIGGRL